MTLTILSVIAALAAQIISGGMGTWLNARAIAPLASKGQLALERMVRELRIGSCVSLNQPDGVTSIQVSNDLGVVRFRHRQIPVDGIYMSINGGTEKLLLEGVVAGDLNFSIPESCLLEISVTLTDTFADGSVLRYPLRTAVHVRKQ